MASASEVRKVFTDQAIACEALDSPFTARICRLFAERLDEATPVGAHVLSWPGDPRIQADSVALRLCGALNHLVVSDADPALAKSYPPAFDHMRHGDEALWQVLAEAMARHPAAIIAFLASAPQTNEVRRSVALIPAYHAIAGRFGQPLAIRELGASAGLNLNAWQYGLRTDSFSMGPQDGLVLAPDWNGETPAESGIRIDSVRGCDLAPIDLSDEAQALRLLAYIWPDQIERVGLIRNAIGLAQASGGQIDREDAIDWLERELETRGQGVATVIQHTVAWQYFPPEAKARGEALLAEHGAQASETAPLARISMENDGGARGARLQLTLWPDGTVHELGRVDFHGRWIDWRNPESERPSQ